jgi:hypothetical protein
MRIAIVAGLLTACAHPAGTYTAHLAAPASLTQVAQELLAYGYRDIKIVEGTITASPKSSRRPSDEAAWAWMLKPSAVRESGSTYERPEIEKRTLVVRPHGSTLALQIELTTCIWDGSSLTGACASRGNAQDEAARRELVETRAHLEQRLARPFAAMRPAPGCGGHAGPKVGTRNPAPE